MAEYTDTKTEPILTLAHEFGMRVEAIELLKSKIKAFLGYPLNYHEILAAIRILQKQPSPDKYV
jgi:hypothetical protein